MTIISSRYIIEVKQQNPSVVWDRFAFPKGDLHEAKEALKFCKSRHPERQFRLLEETIKVIEVNNE